MNDSIWKNQEKSSLRSNNSNDSIKRMLPPENVSPVKLDNSCFQYGFPSLFELNQIYSYHQTSNQKEMREINRGFSISHIHENSILKRDTTDRFHGNNQFYSLFHYDLLFNRINKKEKLVSQNCSCCPFIDLSKSSCEIQRQNDSIITKKDDDFSYVRSISFKHIPEKPDSNILQSDNSLKNVNNNLMLNRFENRRLIVQNVPSKDVSTKPVDEQNNFTKLRNLSIPLEDKSLDGDLNDVIISNVHNVTNVSNMAIPNVSIPNLTILNMSIPKEESVHHVNSNIIINNNNERLNDYKFKSKSSTLTVERVQKILEFYHSASKDFTKIQENNDYSSYDEKESFNNVDFFDISNVKLLKCTQCDKEFSDINSREKHIKNDHKFICKISNKVSFHTNKVQLHDEKVHDNYIKKKPKRRTSRQTKRKRNPGTVRTYSCCGQIFKTGREFGIHKSTHKYMRNNRRDVNTRI